MKSLHFTTEQEFKSSQNQHQIEYPGLLEKNRDTTWANSYEQDVLQKAENAIKNAFVRQVASMYPERPEMAI